MAGHRPLAYLRWHRQQQLFDRFWVDLAAEGVCDALGGAEYRRIRNWWVEHGRPDPEMTIRFQASRPAPGQEDSEPG